MRSRLKFMLKNLILALIFISCTKDQFHYVNTNSNAKLYPANNIKGGTKELDTPSWIVAIFDKKTNAFLCTGEILNQLYILTARHCTSANKSLYIKYLGPGPRHDYVDDVENFTFFPKASYDIVLLKLVKPYPIQINETVKLFHGYYFYPYKELNIYKLMLLAYGGTYQLNELFSLNVEIINMYGGLLDGDSLNGKLVPGDSGGALIYKAKHVQEDIKKLVGVTSSIRKGISTYSYINKEVLEWIAKQTGNVIFEYPLDSQYIDVESKSIKVLGWGSFPKSSSVIITNKEGTKTTGGCNQVEQVTPNSWKCQANFNGNVSDNPYYIYIKNSTGDTLDTVEFEVESVLQDIVIDHPRAEGEFHDYIFNIPKDSLYWITGRAALNADLVYGLFASDKTTLLSDKPCVNESKAVDVHGIWKCELQNSLPESSYVFQVHYPESSHLKSVASVPYNIISESDMSLSILTPNNNSEIFSYPYDITIAYSADFTQENRRVKLLWLLDGDIYAENEIYITNESGKVRVQQEQDNASFMKSSKVTLKVGIYNGDDELPVIESVVSFLQVSPSIDINTNNLNNISIGKERIISGVAYTGRHKNNWYVAINTIAPSELELGSKPIEINDDGTWSMNDDPVSFHEIGEYKITAYLGNPNVLNQAGKIVQFESVINVHVNKEVEFSAPDSESG